MNDVIIIGAGVAGLTAAIYARRSGLSVLVFDKNIYGGQLVNSNIIENYPGFDEISGVDLALNIYNQAIKQGVDIKLENVKEVFLDEPIKRIFTNKSEYEARAVIISNGVNRRKLKCKGEDEFRGRGVSYCATCDGNFFKDREVAIVGGGNTSLEESIFLSNICKKVSLIYRGEQLKGENALIKSVESKENVDIICNTVVSEICGRENVSHLMLKSLNTNEEYKLQVSGIFIAIGFEPSNSMFKPSVDIDDKGYIVSNEECKTNVDGVFVAGDTRSKSLRQIVTAESDGATAAVQAAKYLLK